MNAINNIPQISARELKSRQDEGDDIFLLDVREPFEAQAAAMGGVLIPMGQVADRLHEIPRDREIVIHCHSGMRSQRVAEFLKMTGYERVANLSGGILAWGMETGQIRKS